jgi:hypothetical protein
MSHPKKVSQGRLYQIHIAKPVKAKIARFVLHKKHTLCKVA